MEANVDYSQIIQVARTLPKRHGNTEEQGQSREE